MARYKKVETKLWGDAKFQRLSPAPPNGQTLWFRLLTGPETNQIPGLIPVGEAALSEALGWSLEGFRKAFEEVFQQGMAEADWRARLIWLPRACHYNTPESPNVVRGWGKVWEEIPESPLKVKAYQGLKDYCEGLGEGFSKAFGEALPPPFAESVAVAVAVAGTEAVKSQLPEQPFGLAATPPVNGSAQLHLGGASPTGPPAEAPVAARKLTGSQMDLEQLCQVWDRKGATRPAGTEPRALAALLRSYRDALGEELGHKGLLEDLESLPEGCLDRGVPYALSCVKSKLRERSGKPMRPVTSQRPPDKHPHASDPAFQKRVAWALEEARAKNRPPTEGTP